MRCLNCLCLLILLGFLSACSASDAGTEQEPEIIDEDPCSGASCQDGERCLIVEGAPLCECNVGLIRAGASCIPMNTSPTLEFVVNPDLSAVEGQLYTYDASCISLNGELVNLSIGADDTCSGELDGALYKWTPRELQGGTICRIHLLCAAGGESIAQRFDLNVQEVNEPPRFTGLPNTVRIVGGPASYTVEAEDTDVPRQRLSFEVVSHTCSFTVAWSAFNDLTWSCGESVERCGATLRVSDGELFAEGMLELDCSNTKPVVNDVKLSPEVVRAPGESLDCDYSFVDDDADADQSTVEWLVNGSVVGTGQSFTSYEAGDEVACRVSPFDGHLTGDAKTSISANVPSVLVLAAGDSFNCLAKDGALYCWGSNLFGQLGGALNSGNTTPNPRPQLVFERGVSAVAAGLFHVCAIHDGEVKCWGSNRFGEIGSTANVGGGIPNPVPVTVLTAPVDALAVNGQHSCAIQQGALKCWGSNRSGQLGVPSNAGDLTPNPTPQVIISAGVTAAALGSSHTCAIQQGALKCWGNNYYGALGHPDDFEVFQPNVNHKVVFTSGVTNVDAGAFHTCAVHEGALKCWGQNDYLQLGVFKRTTFEPSLVPVQGSDQIACGAYHSCSLLKGELRCWGSNFSGQLGLRYTGLGAKSATPDVILAMGVRAVSTGSSHTCAYQDNVVKCWGLNKEGQLGSTVNVGKSTPNITPLIVTGF